MNLEKTLPQSRLEGEEVESSQPQRQELVVSTDKKADGHAKKRRGNFIHGMSAGGTRNRLLEIHSSMIQRCYSKTYPGYKRYGARGIQVCDRWRFGDGKLVATQCFAADMGNRPSDGHTLERINNKGNYEPSNCRWATQREQANNRSSNVVVEFNGKKQTAAQWSRELGFGFSTLRKRLGKYGWSVWDALTRPVQTKKKK